MRVRRFARTIAFNWSDRLGRAVVPLHQLLARAPRRRVHEAELAREPALLIEQQPVLAAIGEKVQPHAQRLQRALVPREPGGLLLGDDAVLREIAPRVAEPRCARDPEDHLQVAQSARILLDVGLEAVGRVVEARVALLLLEQLGLAEGLAGPSLRRMRLRKRANSSSSPHRQARFEQIGLDR